MTDAAQLLAVARRHLCDVEEIAERVIFEGRADDAECHLAAVSEILRCLQNMRAYHEIDILWRDVRQLRKRAERIADLRSFARAAGNRHD